MKTLLVILLCCSVCWANSEGNKYLEDAKTGGFYRTSSCAEIAIAEYLKEILQEIRDTKNPKKDNDIYWQVSTQLPIINKEVK
jgi:hypothetical protein